MLWQKKEAEERNGNGRNDQVNIGSMISACTRLLSVGAIRVLLRDPGVGNVRIAWLDGQSETQNHKLNR